MSVLLHEQAKEAEMTKMSDSNFAVSIFLSIVILSLVAGFGAGVMFQRKQQLCYIELKGEGTDTHRIEGTLR